jgi:O-acetylserine/cysteine efflux transporter
VTTPSRAFAPLDLAMLLSIALIWGVNNILAKIAIDALPPMMMAATRFAIVLVVLIWWIKPPPKGQWPLFFAMLAFIGPLHFAIQSIGLKLATDMPPMIVAMQLWAPASVVVAAIVLRERVSPLRWAGVGLAFIGAASMNFDPAVFAQAGPLFLVGLASVVYGIGTVLVRKLGGGLDPWATQAWIAVAAAPTLSIASLTFESGHVADAQAAHWSVWAFIGFGAIVSSIVANAFMFKLLQKYEVSRTTPYLLLTPVISFALAVVILGNHVSLQILLGAAVALAGVALVALAERRFKPIAPAVAEP